MALRAFSLAALGGGSEIEVSRRWDAAAAQATHPMWDRFIRAERCAGPLARVMADYGISVPREWSATLRQYAQGETARVLTARNQLHALEGIAAEHDVRPVVLKGGLHAVRGGPALDLIDLDVLLQPGETEFVARALDRAGYAQAGSSPRHLNARRKPSAVPIEIHVALDRNGALPSEDVWRRIRPIEGSGLWRLGAADHLWHVLIHATVDHADRRGRLRDLMVIGYAVRTCTEEDLRETAARVARHEHRAALEAVLEMARALADGSVPADRYREVAVARVAVLRYLATAPLPGHIAFNMSRWVTTSTLDRGARRVVWSEVRQRTLDVSAFGALAAVERRAPRLGRAVRLASRVARHTLTYVLAIPLILIVRGAVGRIR